MEQVLLQLNYTLENIHDAVQQFWDMLFQYKIFAFSGDMGAGKTTFIHYLCEYLEVEDAVSSPTFALINEYHFKDNGIDKVIFHIDGYRLKNTGEAIGAGIEDCILQAKAGNVFCFIEWPEKIKELLSAPYLWLNIEAIGWDERKMEIKLVN